MGLSFLKVAFATNPKYGVEYPVVIGAFAAGFALWSIYVDGVLPLGFPVRAGPQRSWLIAQLGLALGVTVAAAAVTALPPSTAGTVTVTGAVLEGGALAAVMAAFAVLALTAQYPAPRLAYACCGAAAAIAAVTVAAIVDGKLPDRTFSAALATLVIAAAAADGLLRRRLRAPSNAGRAAGAGARKQPPPVLSPPPGGMDEDEVFLGVRRRLAGRPGTAGRGVRDPDGGATITLAPALPGGVPEANWLPAPAGRFRLGLRVYYPGPAVADGSWTPPR